MRLGCLASISALIASAGATQAPADQKAGLNDAIVVTGNRITPEEARRQANDFVRRIGIADNDKPVARWADGICPKVIGLDDRYAAIVGERVREIAKAAKVPIGPARCTTNIVISFSTDAAADARRIATRAPGTLNEVPMAARDALLTGQAPIRWWYATREQTASGRGEFGDGPGWTSGNAEGGGSMLPGGLPAYGQYSSSMISTQMVRVLKAATVLIDIKAAEGQPLDGVAAYAALVALAEIRPSDPPPARSILAMFAEKDGARALTERDETLLRALYRLPLDRGGRRHRGLIVRDLVSAETSR